MFTHFGTMDNDFKEVNNDNDGNGQYNNYDHYRDTNGIIVVVKDHQKRGEDT